MVKREVIRLDSSSKRPTVLGWAARVDETSRRFPLGVLAIGGLLTALGASSCCVLPFLFFTLGISGAWIGNLTALAPYQPFLMMAALGFLGLGFWRVYCRAKAGCAPASACAGKPQDRLAKAGMIVASLLILTAAGFNRIAPVFLN